MSLVIHSCLTLWDPMDCSSPGSSVHGDFPRKNTGVGCHALFQGIFPTQGSNPGLPHCRQILYQLSHKGSLRIMEWVAISFSSGSSRPRNQTGVSCICRRILYQLSNQGNQRELTEAGQKKKQRPRVVGEVQKVYPMFNRNTRRRIKKGTGKIFETTKE